MSLFLGVDAGTQGAKALVYDAERARVVGRGATAYALLPATEPGAAEQHPQTWIDGASAAIEQALEGIDRSAVGGLAVSGQQHGCVVLDRHDAVIRPAKLWCDTSTAAEAAELSERLGRPIPPGFTAPKLLWLRRREPEHFARLRRVLLPHDYLNLWLTGRAVAEAGDASGTGYLDASTRAYDLAACATIDPRLEACLPPLVEHDAAIGTLRPAIAERFGLPAAVPVAPGSGDNMMSAIGAGAVREGVMVASLGTSGTLFGFSARPIIDPEGWIAPFCDATGGWLPLLCTMNCTTVVEEVRQAFASTHAALTAAAGCLPAGCDGLQFLPYLAGERAPNWPHASGALLGLRPGGLQPGRLYRAALEGATLALRQGFARMAGLGLSLSELHLVGGGSRNPLWRQIVADVFAVPVRLPLEAESAALGAAVQAAAMAAGIPVREFMRRAAPPMQAEPVLPDPEAMRTYAEAGNQFGASSRALFAPGT